MEPGAENPGIKIRHGRSINTGPQNYKSSDGRLTLRTFSEDSAAD